MTSLDKVMTVVPGNSRCLYIVFPRKSIVVGLDVATGNVSWNQSIGPLSNEKSFPTVDNNGKEMPYFVIIQIIFILTGFYFSKIHCAHSIFVFNDYPRKTFMFLFSWYTQNCHVLNSIRRSFRLAAPRVADQNQTEFSLLFSVLFFVVLFVVSSTSLFILISDGKLFNFCNRLDIDWLTRWDPLFIIS